MRYFPLVVASLILFGCVQPEVNDVAIGPNRNPVIVSLKAEPQQSAVGDFVTVTAEANDPDDDDLSYDWYMTAGDLTGNGSVVRYVATYCCAGVNTIRLTVKDGRGGSATKAVDVTVWRPRP